MDDPVTVTEGPFNVLAARIRREGKPYIGGASLRETASQAAVVCEKHGKLPPEDAHGWVSDWITLCGAAMEHAQECGSRVAVESWHGAVYGPREDEDRA